VSLPGILQVIEYVALLVAITRPMGAHLARVFGDPGSDQRNFLAKEVRVITIKPISGKEDQAGGLIFRMQDKDNYHIGRANALEDNLVFSPTSALAQPAQSAGAKVANGVWHELRVGVRGNAFVAFLDGQQVLDVTDDRYTSGGIGLWTKSDSVTCFDDVAATGG
jgi:hypothetical protein